MKVIIPAAKIVPVELQNLGRLPAIIYPVNQRIMFDYLYDQYEAAEFSIVCYENIDIVRRRLLPYKNTTIINLDKLGDLGFSVYTGIKGISGEVIVNFADTIVMDDTISGKKDALFYSEDFFSKTWTFFEEKHGHIYSIIDKRENTQIDFGKLFVGVFKFSHVEHFVTCLERAFKIHPSDMDTFYFALMLYSKKYPIESVKTDNWFDIGHADKYYNSQLEVKARTFNHIKIDRDRGILTKTSDEIDKFIGEIKWYIKLPSDVEYVRPRIFQHSLEYSSPFISMEYYTYHTLHELYLFSDISKNQWKDIFKRIQFVCSEFRRYTVKDSNIRLSLEDMYYTKTVHRIENLRKDINFASLFNRNIIINSKMYFSLEGILDTLEKIIPELLYDIDEFCIIHGDLCFSNIMVDNNFNFVKVIDPRGKFGRYDIYGDQRYEIAKLMHSLDGKYDFIIKDLFDISYDIEKIVIDFHINDRKRPFDLYSVFLETFANNICNDLKKFELIEALLFLSMIPLHKESVDQQMAMLATGLEILNRVEPITV